MSKKSFIGGTIILMLAGFIVRILGFVYRIYLSNLIGAEGMGLFALISPIYSLVILTLTSGISIAVSKMVAEEFARKHIVNLKRITYCALVIVVVAGVVVSGFMFIYARFIVETILKDSRTYYSLMLLIPCIPIIAAASAIKGYFYGMQDVAPTAISQIVEQVVRITLVMAMAGYFLNIGLEYACALAVIGMAFGEMANLFVVAVVYFRRKSEKPFGSGAKRGLLRKRTIVRELVKISIPVSFNRFINSVMSAVEDILIPSRLLAGGLDYKSSLEEYGRLLGMAMPLLFFPSVITSALSTTLVAAISEGMSLKNYKMVNYRISKSVQLTFVIGFIFTGVFLAYPVEIGNLLYKKENIGNMLYMLSFTCVFLYVQQTLLGILNGLGKQGISLRNSLIGSSIRIGFVYYAIPVYGITGYVWGIIASTSCVCAMNLFYVVKATGMALDFRNWIIKPGLVGVIMYAIGKYIYSFFEIFGAGDRCTIILTVCGNVTIAICLMVIAGAVDRKEIMNMIGFKKR